MENLFNLTDENLLSTMLTDNNEDAIYDEIIRRHKSTVEIIASKYQNNFLERDDLIQEGYIGLYAAIKSFNSSKNTKFITYASRCISNAIKSALSKISRMKDIPQSNVISLDDDSIDTKACLSAEDEYLAKESVNIITARIYEELSHFESDVLHLHLSGLSYIEIGDKLGKSAKAVDNALQRIRKKLNGVTF